MKSPHRNLLLFLAFALSPMLMGCRHSAKIRSEPPGAKVWVNLVPSGNAPVSWESRSGFPATARLRVSLPGYETLRDVPMEKSYRADASLLLLIPGIIPYFFSARFDDEIVVKLEKEKA